MRHPAQRSEPVPIRFHRIVYHIRRRKGNDSPKKIAAGCLRAYARRQVRRRPCRRTCVHSLVPCIHSTTSCVSCQYQSQYLVHFFSQQTTNNRHRQEPVLPSTEILSQPNTDSGSYPRFSFRFPDRFCFRLFFSLACSLLTLFCFSSVSVLLSSLLFFSLIFCLLFVSFLFSLYISLLFPFLLFCFLFCFVLFCFVLARARANRA